MALEVHTVGQSEVLARSHWRIASILWSLDRLLMIQKKVYEAEKLKLQYSEAL